MRAVLAGCSQNWATLDEFEKAAWASWAALHPRTDSLGSVVTLTGAMAFNSVNCLLVMVGLAAVSAPPADPLPDPPVIVTLTVAAPDSVEFAFTPTPIPATTKLLLYASPPQGSGVSFCGDLRWLAAKAAAATSPADIGTEYNTRYGNITAGQRIFGRARLLRHDGGFSPFSNLISAVSS